MSESSGPDLLIATWLDEEAPDRAPERLLAASRQRIAETPQRRRLAWGARRASMPNLTMRTTIGAVAAVTIAVVGLSLVPRGGVNTGVAPVGTPSAAVSTPMSTPMPTPTATSAASATPLPTGIVGITWHVLEYAGAYGLVPVMAGADPTLEFYASGWAEFIEGATRLPTGARSVGRTRSTGRPLPSGRCA